MNKARSLAVLSSLALLLLTACNPDKSLQKPENPGAPGGKPVGLTGSTLNAFVVNPGGTGAQVLPTMQPGQTLQWTNNDASNYIVCFDHTNVCSSASGNGNFSLPTGATVSCNVLNITHAEAYAILPDGSTCSPATEQPQPVKTCGGIAQSHCNGCYVCPAP